jgi:hypothetical protein
MTPTTKHTEEALEVLNLSISQELLGSGIPARFAYTARDGSPRVVPVGFHWNGAEIVVCTTTNAKKVPALVASPRVALTIDTNGFPPHVLLVRGTAHVEIVEGVPDDYVAASRKLVGPEAWDQWEAGVRALYDQMARIVIEPTWAKLLDFETTLPSNVEELIREKTERG